jgi:cellulose synthase/poly-beta-1,6-N-acetylglucosamine synthase-like glycosyltransferase
MLVVAYDPIISDYDITMEISIFIGPLYLGAAFVYLLVHIGLIAGLKRKKIAHNKTQPFVSIIVAARNEENTIGRLIRCLMQQTYPNYEIIIIDDRSTDNTAKLIGEFCTSRSAISCINITSIDGDMPAKKNALRAGIASSKGEILCFTDADCFPPSTWVEELVKLFEPQVGLVAGYSPYLSGSEQIIKKRILHKLFFKFIEYEEFRAAVWSAGSIGWDLGWLCTGRNLAYRRKTYDEVGGFEKIKMSISGDDDLFMQVVRRNTAWDIRYISMPGSFVPTLPPNNIRSFVEQRKRHFSAAKYFTFPMKLFFFLYHTSNFILVISPILFVLNLLSNFNFIMIFTSKMISDTLLFAFSSDVFDSRAFRRTFFLMEIIYVFYNTLIGPLSLFRKFEWKQSPTK